jgi:ABC-type transport system involved in multi-copper enzyme maturation permease subunit
MWKPLDPLARLSPFRYYSPYQIVVAGEVPVWDISLLAGVALVACVLAYMVFSRRDF